MNWDKAIKNLPELNSDNIQVSASERENERAAGLYNRALEQIADGNSDVAMISLDRLTSEFPLFAEAAHLYGLCLGQQKNFSAAEKMLRQAELSDLSEDDFDAVREAKLAAREGKIRAQEKVRSRKQKEDKLSGVKANLARGGILEKTDHSKRADKMRMATAREREEVMQQIRAQEQDGLPRGIEIDTGNRSNRWLQFVSIIVIICSVIFLVFYFFIRPGIIKRQEIDRKLSWIEQEMESRAEDDVGIADMLTDYMSKFGTK